jgi:hypothetical protein
MLTSLDVPPAPPGTRIAYSRREFQFGELRVPSGSGPHPHRDPWRLLARALRLDAHRAFGLHRIAYRVCSEELEAGNIISSHEWRG